VQHRHEGGPGAAFGLPLYQLAPAWAVLIALASLAWVVTIDQARGMGIGTGTMAKRASRTGGAVHFVSPGYFLTTRGLRLLSPGLLPSLAPSSRPITLLSVAVGFPSASDLFIVTGAPGQGRPSS
jgi:hypothetical protein